MGAKNTTPSSAKRQNKTGRNELSPQVHKFVESRATYASNSAPVNVHEAVGLCRAPEILLVTSQQSIPEIQPLGNKAIIPEQTVAGYIEKDERLNIKQQTVAEYLGKNNGSTIPQQTVAGYVNSDNTTNTSRQTISSYVDIDDKATTPQQTSTGCVEKGDAATILLQNISEYVEEDVTSTFSSQGGAGYIPGDAGNAISRQTRTKYADCDNTVTSLQQSATEAESIISKTAVVKKEVIDISKTDQVTSGQQQRDDVSLKLDAAILQNFNHLFKSTVTENMNWETKTHISIAENEVLETERGLEDRDIKIKSKPEIDVSKPENKNKKCYSDLQPFIQETENGTGCAEDERRAPKNEESSNHISEKILQSTLKERSMQNLGKTTQYVKKTPENELVDNENIILAKADATEIIITEEEVGINTAEGPKDDESVKMNEDKDVLKLDQATDNRDECVFGGENADLDPTHFGAVQDRISVSASETVVLGEKYDGETMIFNNREYCIGSSFKRQSDFDSFHKAKFSRESLATRFSIDEGLCKDEKSQTQSLLRDERPQNPNLRRNERPQNLNLLRDERPQNPNLCRNERPQNRNLCRNERPQNPNLFRDDRPQNPNMFRDDRPQNPNMFRDDRPQNPNMFRDDRPQNPNMFRNDRPQNPNMFRDDRPQNPNMFRDDRPQNPNMFRDDRPQNPNLCRNERLQNRNLCRNERPQNPNLLRDQRPQNPNLLRDQRPQNPNLLRDQRPQNPNLLRDEGPQNPNMLRDERPQNPNMFRDERPQNPNMFRDERPQNPNMFRDDRPQNPNMFRNDRPQNPNMFRDDRPQNPNMFRDDRPQNPNMFRDDRPQNPNMFRDDRPQNPNMFMDDRSQNPNLFRDERPQNQITSKSKNVQNQSIFPKESAQSPLVSTSECLHGSHALSRERSQNSSVLARQGEQRSLMSSQERGRILSMSANDTSKDKNINFIGMVGRSKKENCRPNRVHSKTTELYVKFAEAIEGNIDILEYIKNRLPPGLEFTMINKTIEQDTKNTIVTLQCKSKRSAEHLKAELAKGNHYSQTKILCFDTLQEVRGLVMKKQRDIEISFEQNMQQITWKSESALVEHYDKLSDVKSRLEKIQSVKSKFMSFEQFKAQRIEGCALEDKAKELELQREEFLKQVEYAVRELTKAKESLNFEKIAKETRLNLAIECNRLSNAFPIYARRSDILEIVKNNQVSVIIGETGSGKSTQIAQYFFQGGLASNGIIACTQPRKIAATSLAVHVAKELGTAVGQVVGYKVGMQTKKTNSTKILYMTDHILLNECLQDRKLSAFSCIIIDEAHERSIYTDLLLGMIKECLKDRPDLRLVITSATINPEVFVRYFVECPVLFVSGRMFPVEVEWKEPVVGAESFGNYQEEAVVKAIEVHEKEDEGDILVFLTSPLETEKCCERFRDLMKGKPLNYVTLQLHGRLQGDEQQKVFDPVSGGKRKIVFATNCAETSVTIPGIKYVIDTGLGKEMKFDPVRKMSTLAVSMVTQSSAKQRQGRAGRLGPGKCFRLYTEDDFKKMNVDSLPEIMKVHIGHAMLKLMELGVDPLKFDYIMSPSIPAMEEAFASLVHIGAVSEEKITDRGKWIAKMPFDPKYGAFVYEAVQVGAGLEAVIIAAASGTSSLFYRAGSNEEKEKADRHKIRFCHEGGDQLTLLSVFREWHKVPEKDKGKWCFSYSINGKAIKSVRETTNEVLHTLKKEMKVDLKFSFGRPEKLDNLLVGLLFKALNRNLSHYLGHAKAGYSIVSTDQRVEVHPSSALVSLGSQSEWIVFDQVMRTSRDFAMQTTPIPESLVLKGIEEGWLHLQIEEAKKKRITVACQEYVGPQMFREFVGPRYVNMRNLETTLSEKFPNSFVVVEADWDKGELKVLSNEKNKECLADSLSQVLAPHRANFQLEESEERIGSMSMDISVRTVIGAGGSIVNVFMPEEFKIVKIFCSLETIDDLSKEDVLIKFGQYGEIKECKKYYRKQKSSTIWGQITFGKTESAVEAVNGTKDEPELCARPNVRLPAHGICGLRTKIQWCRRRSRGYGFVEFANVEDFMAACRLRVLSVGGSTAMLNVAKKSPQSIYVIKFNHLVTEDVLRQAFADALNIDPVKSIVRVNVIRKNVGLDKERFSIAKRTLLRKIEEFAQPGTFSLEVREPRSEKDINFIAFCMFNNLDVGYTACDEMNKEFYICNERVSVKVDIHSSLFIRKDIFKISGDAVKEEIKDIENESKEVKIKVKYLKSENVSVEFHTESVNALAQARKRIQVIIRGDIIDCENNDQVRLLFTREGRKRLQTIMNDTGALLITDDRVMALSIHGSLRSRMNAKADVDEYLQQLSQGTIKYIDLKGTGKPSGVMKALMLKYGTDLYGMQTTAKLTTVNLDLRNHRVRLMGSDKAINEAVDIVDAVMTSLTGSGVITSSDDDPDCVTCFCPVESKDLFRLECCGHAYCKECIKLQVDTAITSKDFPIVCGNEGCSSKFVWRDFVNLSRQGHITLAKLVNASLNSYVAQHKNDFHYCTTPDCPIVYRIREGGVPFFCPECNVKVCSSCHVNYHDGLTCIMYKKMNEDDSLGAWLMKDINNRKICPNCSTPIEKIEGCNKMLCLGCKKCLCWICLAVFNTESECYGHLRRVHGGFM
ncbi:uncharacterized protein [Procambarus clarkii]|uniref:uncharacterized protein n=1 Tax=Procambarus clarkii TaxID=6728 RepID=UPI003742E1DA